MQMGVPTLLRRVTACMQRPAAMLCVMGHARKTTSLSILQEANIRDCGAMFRRLLACESSRVNTLLACYGLCLRYSLPSYFPQTSISVQRLYQYSSNHLLLCCISPTLYKILVQSCHFQRCLRFRPKSPKVSARVSDCSRPLFLTNERHRCTRLLKSRLCDKSSTTVLLR